MSNNNISNTYTYLIYQKHAHMYIHIQGVQEKLCFYQVLSPLPLQYWAAIGCTENDLSSPKSSKQM